MFLIFFLSLVLFPFIWVEGTNQTPGEQGAVKLLRPSSLEAGSNLWWDCVREGNLDFSDGEEKVFNGQREIVCKEIGSGFEEKGFLTSVELDECCVAECRLCKHKCAKVRKHSKPSEASNDFVELLFSNLEKAYLYEEDNPEEEYIDEMISDVMMGVLVETLWRLAPLLLSFIPLFMNEEYVNKYVTFLYLAGIWTMWTLTMFTVSHAIFCSYICVVCCMKYGGRSLVSEVSYGFAVLVIYVFTVLYTNIIVQIVYIAVAIFFYWMMVTKMMSDRRHTYATAIIVNILLILVLFEQFTIIRDVNMYDNLNLQVTEAIIGTIFPYGRSCWGIKNFAFNARSIVVSVAKLIPVFNIKKQAIAFLLITVVQAVMLYVFRGLFGSLLVKSMNFTNEAVIYNGFMIYGSDIFGGIIAMVNQISGRERPNARRMNYGFVNLVFLYFEYFYCREFVILRAFLKGLDLAVYRGFYSELPKYLNANVNMSGRVFKQDGSFPFRSMKKLAEYASATVELTISGAKESFKGLAIINSYHNKKRLFTIRHLTESLNLTMGLEGQIMNNFSILAERGQAPDPVMEIPIEGVFTTERGAEFDMLVAGDIPEVSELWFFVRHRDDPDDIAFTNVPNFKFEDNGEITASVDLQHGDSGGPVFAFLKDGRTRYAGAVSKGNENRRGGNYISSIITENPTAANLDSDSEDSREYGRGPNLRFIGDIRSDKLRVRDKAYEHINDHYLKYRNACALAKVKRFKIIIDERNQEDPFVIVEDDDEGTGHDGGQDKESHYVRPKGRRHKRARKQFQDELNFHLKSVRELMDTVFDTATTRNLFAQILSGTLKPLDTRATYQSSGSLTVVTHD